MSQVPTRNELISHRARRTTIPSTTTNGNMTLPDEIAGQHVTQLSDWFRYRAAV